MSETDVDLRRLGESVNNLESGTGHPESGNGSMKSENTKKYRHRVTDVGRRIGEPHPLSPDADW